MFPPIVRKTFDLNTRGSLCALTLAVGLIIASPPIATAGSNPGSLIFGPSDALHVVVTGNSSAGYGAEIYDGNQLVTTRGLAGKYDLTVFPGTSDNQPTGPNILTDPTLVSSWQGPSGMGLVPCREPSQPQPRQHKFLFVSFVIFCEHRDRFCAFCAFLRLFLLPPLVSGSDSLGPLPEVPGSCSD